MKKTQRFERRLNEAQAGNEREILEKYGREIREQKVRRDSSRNAFVKTCAQQEIDQLTAEKDAIEEEVIG